jgi:hypothetical protein
LAEQEAARAAAIEFVLKACICTNCSTNTRSTAARRTWLTHAQNSAPASVSFWDGSQRLPIDPEEILGALADDLMEYGDLRWRCALPMSRHAHAARWISPGRSALRKLREKKERSNATISVASAEDIKKQPTKPRYGTRAHRSMAQRQNADGTPKETNFSDDLMKGSLRAGEALISCRRTLPDK